MEKANKIRFVNWLINRLVHKHGYSTQNSIILALYELTKTIKEPTIDIDDDSLDKIISKYYVDFNLEKSDDLNIGYSNDERIKLRSCIRMLINDVIKNDIPKDFTIKG